MLKYEALDRAARLAAGERGPEYREQLKALSARWPAALRESELIGAQRVAERLDVARSWLDEAADRPANTRIEAALWCWSQLHGAFRDQLEFRRALARADPRDSATVSGFASWLERGGLDGDPERARRWPDPTRLPGLVGDKLQVRVAYLWLAARAGLDLSALNELLFERSGHWDSRPDDPSWSIARGEKTF